MTMGVAGLVLLLGAVGQLNISMVTLRYRVREMASGAASGQRPRGCSRWRRRCWGWAHAEGPAHLTVDRALRLALLGEL